MKGWWDGDRLAEVLSNLLSNAFKYGDPDAPVAMAGRCGDECVVVDVTNQGPEIPAPLRDVIFDPFQRGPTEQHRGIKGIGLGLYIAQQIVRAHHGEIAALVPGRGTAFSVTLPRSIEEGGRPTRGPESIAPLRHRPSQTGVRFLSGGSRDTPRRAPTANPPRSPR